MGVIKMLFNDVFFLSYGFVVDKILIWKKKINEVLFYLGYLCDEIILCFWLGIIGSFWWGKLIKYFWIGEFCLRREIVF